MLKLSKKPLPMIGKLTELLVPGNRAGFFEVGTSPRGPLDLKMQLSTSPRSLKNHDLGGGVGLGIVAALEKSSHNRREILAKYSVCSNSPSRSDPIPVSSGQKGEGFQKGIPDNYEEEDCEENYTFVTCHGMNKSVTKVYYDGGESTAKTKVQASIFETCNDNPNTSYVYPTTDFLSSCHLCSKDLHGKDIYMYRGDKAFCSTECRSTQIVNDERKEREQCRSEAKRRSADVSSSSYSKNQIFFSAGILAV